MANKLSLEEVLQSEAEFGLFYAYAKISQKKASELRKQGFLVTCSVETKKYPRIHKISWIHCVLSLDNLDDLDENDPMYTLPQKLWIIAFKTKQKNT